MGLPIGGGELQLIYLAKGLANQGEQVYLIDLEGIKDLQYSENLQLISFKKYISNKQKIFKFYHLYHLLKIIKADVYHCRIRGWIHLIPYLASKRTGAIFTLSLASNLDASNFYERYKYFYKFKGLLYFFTNGILSEIIFPYLLKKSALVFVQNIYQNKKLDSKNIKNEILPNIYPLSENNWQKNGAKEDYFVYVGSLDLRKGFDIFLRLARDTKNIKYKVIGNFRQNFNSTNYLNNIEYLGRLPHSAVLAFISSAKSLISTSRMEGFPNIFLEAWANGVPVISYSVDPNNLLESKKLGLYCRNNYDKLVSYVVEFDKYEFKPQEIYDYVFQNHTVKSITTKFQEYINLIINKN